LDAAGKEVKETVQNRPMPGPAGRLKQNKRNRL
jgi:hypothetical protein